MAFFNAVEAASAAIVEPITKPLCKGVPPDLNNCNRRAPVP